MSGATRSRKRKRLVLVGDLEDKLSVLRSDVWLERSDVVDERRPLARNARGRKKEVPQGRASGNQQCKNAV